MRKLLICLLCAFSLVGAVFADDQVPQINGNGFYLRTNGKIYKSSWSAAKIPAVIAGQPWEQVTFDVSYNGFSYNLRWYQLQQNDALLGAFIWHIWPQNACPVPEFGAKVSNGNIWNIVNGQVGPAACADPTFNVDRLFIVTNSQPGDRDGDGIPDDEDLNPDDPDEEEPEDPQDPEDPEDPGEGEIGTDWVEWRKNFADNPFITSILDALLADYDAAAPIIITINPVLNLPFFELPERTIYLNLEFSAIKAPVVIAGDTTYKPFENDETWKDWLGYINFAFKCFIFLAFCKGIMDSFADI